MENKNYIHIPLITNSNLNTKTSPIPFLISTPLNSQISSLDHRRSTKPYSETIVVTKPTVRYRDIRIYFNSSFYLVNY